MKRHLVSLAAATFLAIPSATPHGGIRYPWMDRDHLRRP